MISKVELNKEETAYILNCKNSHRSGLGSFFVLTKLSDRIEKYGLDCPHIQNKYDKRLNRTAKRILDI